MRSVKPISSGVNHAFHDHVTVVRAHSVAKKTVPELTTLGKRYGTVRADGTGVIPQATSKTEHDGQTATAVQCLDGGHRRGVALFLG